MQENQPICKRVWRGTAPQGGQKRGKYAHSWQRQFCGIGTICWGGSRQWDNKNQDMMMMKLKKKRSEIKYKKNKMMSMKTLKTLKLMKRKRITSLGNSMTRTMKVCFCTRRSSMQCSTRPEFLPAGCYLTANQPWTCSVMQECWWISVTWEGTWSSIVMLEPCL